ncbi:hypothetical protein Dalk_4596 [Desulfatibacillum aliphaticivorans]|uniref:Uncharacterized protein n=1 Tax=Desulfatibacillum aliphaticivorans TaxID=218208 RepID=B8FNJ3_DESAL|nr:hypothetical protein Dalk_4596 [Desulfatibacillum aliphaticivorans]
MPNWLSITLKAIALWAVISIPAGWFLGRFCAAGKGALYPRRKK